MRGERRAKRKREREKERRKGRKEGRKEGSQENPASGARGTAGEQEPALPSITRPEPCRAADSLLKLTFHFIKVLRRDPELIFY